MVWSGEIQEGGFNLEFFFLSYLLGVEIIISLNDGCDVSFVSDSCVEF